MTSNQYNALFLKKTDRSVRMSTKFSFHLSLPVTSITLLFSKLRQYKAVITRCLTITPLQHGMRAVNNADKLRSSPSPAQTAIYIFVICVYVF